MQERSLLEQEENQPTDLKQFVQQTLLRIREGQITLKDLTTPQLEMFCLGLSIADSAEMLRLINRQVIRRTLGDQIQPNSQRNPTSTQHPANVGEYRLQAEPFLVQRIRNEQEADGNIIKIFGVALAAIFTLSKTLQMEDRQVGLGLSVLVGIMLLLLIVIGVHEVWPRRNIDSFKRFGNVYARDRHRG